jgi:hypothetical protein
MLQPGQPLQAAPVIPPGAIQPTAVAPSRPFPWRRVSILAGVGVVLGLLVVVLIVLIRVASPEAGAVAEKRSHTRIEEEELVKRFILNNAKDAKAVQFTKWGPHMKREEYDKLMEEAGPEKAGRLVFRFMLAQGVGWQDVALAGFAPEASPTGLIRVCYRDPNDKRGIVTADSKINLKPGVVVEAKRLADKGDIITTDSKINPGFPELDGQPEGEHDYVFVVSGKLVLWRIPNREGDEWKQKLRKNLAKVFPGINP